MNKYVIDTQALIKFLNGVKVINENIDLILRKTEGNRGNRGSATLLQKNRCQT